MNLALHHPLSEGMMFEDEISEDDTDTASLAAELRFAESLLDLGQVRSAEDVTQRVVVRALQLGEAHYRGVGYSILARIQAELFQRHGFRIESLEALRYLDYDRDPDRFLDVVFELSLDFLPGRPAPPRFASLAREIRERRTRPDQVPWSLFRWLEGRALHSRGRLPRAAAALSGARRRCLKLEAARPAIAITLDLVAAYLDIGLDRTARIAVRDTVRTVADLELDDGVRKVFLDYEYYLVAATEGRVARSVVDGWVGSVRVSLFGE